MEDVASVLHAEDVARGDVSADPPIAVEAVEALPGEALVDPVTDVPPPAPVDLMNEQEFAEFFLSLFPITGETIGAMRPPPLQSLMRAGDLPAARPASDAIFRICMRTPWMHWLLDKNMNVTRDLVLIGAFGLQLRAAIQAEIAMREPAKDEPRDDG